MNVCIDLDNLQQRAASDLESALRTERTWPASFRAIPRPPHTHAVTLALIARIRELETALSDLADALPRDQRNAVSIDATVALLQKGVALSGGSGLSRTDLTPQADGV